jgi:2-keto-4-pentenoate hydratase
MLVRITATNTAAEVLGNPLSSLPGSRITWPSGPRAERGLNLTAGDVVMSGSISVRLRPKAGDVVTARFTRLGSVGVPFG